MVMGMVAVISLAIYSTFNNGLKIWQRLNQSLVEEDLDIFFDRFAFDLRNSFNFSGFNLLGEENKLEFSTFIDSARLNRNTVGKVIYFYDSQREILNRSPLDFAEVYEGIETYQPILRKVKSLKFEYYFYDEEKKEYCWEKTWSREKFPLAVRVELEMANNEGLQRFTKTVNIPISG